MASEEKREETIGFARGFRESWHYLRLFIVWIVVGLLLGVLGGLAGTAFCYGIRCATAFRGSHSWIVWLLPVGGVVIVWLYSLRGETPTDTNGVLLAVRKASNITVTTGPLIFVSTVLTHLLGGSAGREGAALQLGGVLGSLVGKVLKLDATDRKLVVMCGMSAVFSALFGAPITAALFAIEVASVGVFHFSAVLPCLTASLTAAGLARYLGVHPDVFPLPAIEFSVSSLTGVILISALCAAVSVLYCLALRRGGHWWARKVPNAYVRVIAGGLAVAVLTWALGTTDYNGAGMDVIEEAMAGHALPYAFALKFLFTVITMTSGYKGGEIVPAMFIGATLGACVGSALGLAPGLGAAVGLLSMFCGSLNCPISSVFLGIEMFGGGNAEFFAIAAAIGYMLSANYGLFEEQKIVYSKIHPEYIDKYTD